MLRRPYKLFLVSTSLAPIFLTLGFLAARKSQWLLACCWIGLVILIVSLTDRLIRAALQQLEVRELRIDSARTSDREVISFLIAYVMPLALTGSVKEVDGWSVAFVVLLFGIVVWGTHAYDFNPLLGLLRYHFFEVKNKSGVTYILITKRKIVSVEQITKVVQLADYVLLDFEARESKDESVRNPSRDKSTDTDNPDRSGPAAADHKPVSSASKGAAREQGPNRV